ncbi:MAG: NUDIX domain-containing protein, partial [Alphaproteobacteria bacterium]
AHRLRHRWRSWRKAPISGCSVIVTNAEGAVLMLRHSYGGGSWSLPGGGIGRRESAEDAARREVREELALEIGTLVAIGEINEVISGCQHTAYVFTGMALYHPRPDGREVVEARFFPGHSLPEPQNEMTRARLALWRARRN